jgi:hypothetical protein
MKKETLQEAADRIAYDSTEQNKGYPSITAFIEGAKWQEEQTMEQTNKTKAQLAQNAMSTFVNSYNVDGKAFIQEMNKEHRTLQQAFTKLCLQWIENVGSEDYRTDGRNEQSKETCKKLLSTFEGDGFKPSEFLSMI